MAPRPTKLVILLVALVALAIPALAILKDTSSPSPIHLSDIENCAPVKTLNALRVAAEALDAEGGGDVAGLKKRAFALMFPFDSPAYNALLSTLYISLFPNLILAFIPPDLDLKSLNVMIGFATGGLLGDTFLNLIPHSFLGEPHPSGDVQIVVVEPKRNVLIGCALFGGFALFFLIDKTMRYLAALTGQDGEDGHSHGHSHSHAASESTAKSSAVEESKGELKKRGGKASVAEESQEVAVTEVEEAKTVNPSLRLGAYLNLFADFTHNITDGLAISAAFYASPAIGATTSLACLAHEVPHEIADASILIKSGFSKWQAMGAQFVTAIGAFVGTLLGIWIQSLVSSTSSSHSDSPDLVSAMLNKSTGILGTSVTPADFTLPACAGAFLYVGAVTVVPELLADARSGRQLVKEMGAMAVGITLMAWLSWNE